LIRTRSLGRNGWVGCPAEKGKRRRRKHITIDAIPFLNKCIGIITQDKPHPAPKEMEMVERHVAKAVHNLFLS